MVFIHDTKRTLVMVVDLVNTLPGYDGEDTLQSPDDLREFLLTNPYTGTIRLDDDEVAAVRAVRARLRELWAVDRAGAVPLGTAKLADGQAPPRLGNHDESPLATRMMVEAAMAFVDVIRSDEYERVRVCAADDCDAVYIDYSKNGSKRYCDTGNCGNRMNVIAYRARKAQETP